MFDYIHTDGKVALLEQLIEQSDWLRVEKLSIDSFEQEDHLLISCVSYNGGEVFSQIAECMFNLSATECENVDIAAKWCTNHIEQLNEEILSDNAHRNPDFFDIEMDKMWILGQLI